jgi:hypothetical protein
VHTLCVTPFYINTGLFDGVKTKVPAVLPLLEPIPVAQAIVAAIEARQHYLELPRFLGISWPLKLIPTGLRDKLLDILGFLFLIDFYFLFLFFHCDFSFSYLSSSLLGVTSSMDDFRGRPQSKL